MPKTTTCFDVISNGSKARGCFSCTVLIPGSFVSGNQTFRNGRITVFASLKKVSWLLLCPVGFTASSFQTELRSLLSSHSFPEPTVHSQPLYVLARYATGCVTDFCCHTPWLIDIPRKNPALCNLAVSRCIKLPQPVALAGNPHTLGFLFGERLLHDRNEMLQS